METLPWLPVELQAYPAARIVLGLLVSEGQEVTPSLLKWLYLGKVEALVKKTPDWMMALETFMPTTADMVSAYLDNNPDPWAVVQNMAEADEWPSAITSLSLYLQKHGTFDDVLDSLCQRSGIDEDPVSLQEFKNELETTNLWEFLDYAC